MPGDRTPPPCSTGTALRTGVVWCADWPIAVAEQADPTLMDRAVIVWERVGPRELVRSVSAQARDAGIRIGMRRREAEAYSTDLVVLDSDEASEAVAFEKVAREVERFTPRVEIHRPGLLSFPALGPSRYFGGDVSLATQVHDVVARCVEGTRRRELARAGVRVGMADGEFAARLAARYAPVETGVRVVAEGESADFLAGLEIRHLAHASLGSDRVRYDDLVALLERLGLSTLGAFAALPQASVLARFGTEVLRLHRLACAQDDRPRDLVPPPPDLVEVIEFDPPATRVDQAAFAAKTLADRLLGRLADLGLGCTRVVVEAETEHGEIMARTWRHEGALSPAALAERVRWQLDSWLRSDRVVRVRSAPGDVRERQDAAAHEQSFETTTGALVVLRLVPDEVVAGGGRQLGFWGGDQGAADRADRALSRIQGMVGHDAVTTPVLQGGRTPIERVRWVPWGEPREPRRPIGPVTGPVAVEVPAWPGAVPGPAPACVLDPAVPAELRDADGDLVQVGGRGEASAVPKTLMSEVLPGGGGRVLACTGPWVHDLRWWDLDARCRRALWQVVVDVDGRGTQVACLVSVTRGQAAIEAVHD